ncbi:hypothetical protein QCA50_007320 [Cerrena zonata]|uniref:Elongin-C n=1 Tax=Cerrena zonata TaxID=2478898 RepID=A0AAW0G795_9APHY
MATEQNGATQSSDDWVRLISADGYKYFVKRKIVLVSPTLRSMLDASSNFAEAASNTCRVNERGAVLEKLLEYLSFKFLYENASLNEDIPDFQERIAPEIALELLTAADYYDS